MINSRRTTTRVARTIEPARLSRNNTGIITNNLINYSTQVTTIILTIDNTH